MAGDGERPRSPSGEQPEPQSAFAPAGKAKVRAALFRKLEPVRVGRFIVLELLGTGGRGEVYAAYDDQLDRRVALKLFSTDFGQTRAEDLQRREAQALAKISHPNVVHVYETGTHEGRPFLAMELIQGQTLGNWLQDTAALPLRVRRREILRKFIAAGRGLEAAHAAGVVHRDFKPENVIVDKDGRVCVVDFGLACALVEPSGMASTQDTTPDVDIYDTPSNAAAMAATQPGMVVGTPAYMAPEQWRGEIVDHRSDQFSFCVALYHSLYGVPPYGVVPFPGKGLDNLLKSMESRTVSFEHSAGVPSRVRKALRRGLSNDRLQRFASMGDLLVALSPAERFAFHPPAQESVSWRTSSSDVPPEATATPGKLVARPEPVDLAAHGGPDRGPTHRTALGVPMAIFFGLLVMTLADVFSIGLSSGEGFLVGAGFGLILVVVALTIDIGGSGEASRAR
jgi:serine/threonine protein kinase